MSGDASGHRQRAVMASDAEWEMIGQMAKRRGMDRSRYLIYRALMPDALSTEVLRRAVRELLVLSLLEERRMREAGAGQAWEDACDSVDVWIDREGELALLTDPGAANRWKALGGDLPWGPLLGARRKRDERTFVVNLPRQDVAHAVDCVFRVEEQPKPPIVHSDVFNLISRADAGRGDVDPDSPVHRKSRGLWQGQRPRTMRDVLWTLMHTAWLHRLAVADGFSSSENDLAATREWLAAIGKAAEQFYLPPKVTASEFLFTDPKSWNSGEVGRRLDAARRDRPEFDEPFALLCWFARDVSEYEVNGKNRELGHVTVRTPVVRPIIGDKPVRGPYLFLGVVELSEDGKRWECTKACAQPIVAVDCPIPVDSHYERRALGSLRSLIRNLTKSGKLKKALGGGVRVELEKPLIRTEVAGGPCLPDFLITVTRPGAYSHLPEGPGHPKHRGRFNPRDRARYVVEVMGFDDEEYERDKEETHQRMRRIGPVFPMEGSDFDSADNPLRRQRETITADIEEDLLERWTVSETT